ncbi:hypothetical protein GCM10009838_85550 [Catenulispora subtropica]|uniref:RNA polymerase sigma-70 region 4 domain-containing protein n=2 Tax=Catenulispora subtropica TaxID=450798 RepID=A0ABN2TDR1_9ACTN
MSEWRQTIIGLDPQDQWASEAWALLPSDRHRQVLQGRLEGSTLDELGTLFGVTREWVRQIGIAGEKRLLENSDALAPGWRDEVRALFEGAIVRTGVELALAIPDPDGIARNAILTAFGAQRPKSWGCRVDEWWTLAADKVTKALRALAETAPCTAEDMDHNAIELGLPPGSALERVLTSASAPLTRTVDGGWVRRRVSGRDAAYLIVARTGTPMRAEDVAEELGEVARNIAESMRRDKRFVQTRPDGLWALADWRLPESNRPGNAHEVAINVLEELGPLPYADFEREVIARYPVSAWRVKQCLSSDLIGETPEGLLDLVRRGATPIEEPEPRRSPSIVANEAGDLVAVRMTVDKDVLRGSGLVVSLWLTWRLGMHHAPTTRRFALDSGREVVVRRGVGSAQLSSLRAEVADLGMGLGCSFAVMLMADTERAALRHTCGDDCPAPRASP